MSTRSATTRPATPAPVAGRPMSLRTVRAFFLATFAFSWTLGVLMVVFMDQVEAVFGPMGYTNPVFILVVWGPGLVGLWLVVRHHGLRGLRPFLARLAQWRMSRAWWLVLLVGMPAVFYAGAAVKGTLDDGFPFSPWYAVVPALLPALMIGPVEELGWRGVALPVLQRRFAPLWAALIVGVVAAVWHTPAFLMSGTKQSAWSFGPFFLGVVAISVILTAMFNAARGSLLVAVLFHAQMNGPAWPDAQPWDMYAFVAVAVLVLLVNRRSMLTRGSGATDVLLGAPEHEPVRAEAAG
ncbi:CPBP family intramembrane glutamic endopeptidase [Nocardioides sp.]|uniref:CPBP family intramembrane glutamic endopeptidase n=1 Tax=Nocardioides sp. TaxID=35761 RepID=UPI0035B1B9CF